MLEKDIEKKVKNYAKKTNWWVGKFTSPSQKGVPDNLFIKKGIHIFIEFKATGKTVKPYSNQYLKIKEMQKYGAKIYQCNNVAIGKKILDSYNAITG